MNTAPAYVAVRFFERFMGFFAHWYVGGTRVFWGRTIEALNWLKRFFESSNKESFLLRFSRAAIGIAGYFIVPVVSIVLYIIWIFFLPYSFLKMSDGFV